LYYFDTYFREIKILKATYMLLAGTGNNRLAPGVIAAILARVKFETPKVPADIG